MEINQTIREIRSISSRSEEIFLQLGNLFPSLLNRDGGTSLKTQKGLFSTLSKSDVDSSAKESALFTDYGAKYNPLFDQLNKKIDDIKKLDKMIAEIKEDSEQMELIALNAMVISIKSGEKGQAFSRITENLQRLSNDMFLFSDKLSDEESQLLDHINTLKKIFSGILDSQKSLSAKGNTGSNEIREVIQSVSDPIATMEYNIDSIYPPIQKAMEGLQLQDMIRQALDHVLRCFDELGKTPSTSSNIDEQLDYVSFNIAIYQLMSEVLRDISGYVSDSCSIFDTNWNKVVEKLDSVETEKNNFEHRFLAENTIGTENLEKRMNALIESFQLMLGEFNNYHVVQKDLLHTCQNITERARTIYAVFDNLKPVMSRLHHVRILQQIEVAKNDAIKSVQDSVTDMDNLIQSANSSLDSMQELLEGFIAETSLMLTTFTTSISKDNENMVALRVEKNKFFEDLKQKRDLLANVIQDFTVFPEGFQNKCVTVQQNLKDLRKIGEELESFIRSMRASEQELSQQKARLLNEKGLSTWDIRNNRFSELIKQFTITAHKEAAGKLSGLAVEKGSASGEVTLF